MFTWIKKLFGITVKPHDNMTVEEYQSLVNEQKGCVPDVIAENTDKLQHGNVVMDHKVIEEPKKVSTKKTTSKSQPSKRGRKKVGVTKTDLNKMTKDGLEDYAKKEFKVDLDKRKKKADLVDQVLELTKKNG